MSQNKQTCCEEKRSARGWIAINMATTEIKTAANATAAMAFARYMNSLPDQVWTVDFV